jgi:hypothetical protein
MTHVFIDESDRSIEQVTPSWLRDEVESRRSSGNIFRVSWSTVRQ